MKAFRIVFQSSNTTIRLSVPTRANRWGEYVIRVRKNGKLQPEPIYFTSERQDAIDVACHLASPGWWIN